MPMFPERSLGKIVDEVEVSRSPSANVTQIAYHGKVISNEDPLNSKRVQVRIEGIDDSTKDADLPWCVSMMPNFFYCLPQVGEHVIIFFMNPWNARHTRLYSGPLQTKNFGEQGYSQDGSIEGTMNTFGFTTFDKG